MKSTLYAEGQITQGTICVLTPFPEEEQLDQWCSLGVYDKYTCTNGVIISL